MRQWWLVVVIAAVGAAATFFPSPRAPAEAPHVAEPAAPVTVLAVGDLLLGSSVKARILAEGADFPFRPAAELLRAADITFGNLECPLTEGGVPTPGKSAESLRAKRNFLFRAPTQCAGGLADAGFDVVSLANNHAMDYSAEGLRDTLLSLEAAGVRSVGAGETMDAACAPVILTRGKSRVAFLGISDVLPAYSAAGQRTPGVAPARSTAARPRFETTVAAQLRDLRQRADFILVSVHWGKERWTRPTPRQVRLGRFLIDAGADGVIGHHPHVLQPIERYRGKPIAYSLGNFISYTGKPRARTLALELTLTRDQPIGIATHPFLMTGGQALPVETTPSRMADRKRIREGRGS
jgi:poly-gamma-glutamate capsule biosynthesis protein CapA/YwtB (metallophosphatase superfamily)